MAKRTSNKPPKQAPKKASVEETQVDPTDEATEVDAGDDAPQVEEKSKGKGKPKAAINPKHRQPSPKEIEEQIDRRVRVNIRDTISRDVKSPLFVRQIMRRWGVSEDQAKAAISKITDQIDELIGVAEMATS